ncbi:MAG: hypothetical protein FJX54_11605 [Alphaproteobacteria bacterium]|nr:hypothetical protein [Alphaproteobacteria bacterium]
MPRTLSAATVEQFERTGSCFPIRVVTEAAHGSEPNRSADRRIGFAIRYIPTRIRQLAGHDFATLVRGRDDYGHFESEPRPKADLDPAAVAAHAEIMRVHTETLLKGSSRQSLR